MSALEHATAGRVGAAKLLISRTGTEGVIGTGRQRKTRMHLQQLRPQLQQSSQLLLKVVVLSQQQQQQVVLLTGP